MRALLPFVLGVSGCVEERPACEHEEEPEPCAGAARGESGTFDEEVCLPGGSFLMGIPDSLGGTDEIPDPQDGDARPQHRVDVSPIFFDRYPVTNERYERCAADGACPELDPLPACGWVVGELATPPPCSPLDPGSPVVTADRIAAAAFCAWDLRQGEPGRLPTEAEYERAVVGLGSCPRTYPWGETPPNCEMSCATYDPSPNDFSWTNICDQGNWCVVGSHAEGDSMEGVADLLGGGVPTADCYVEDFYASADAPGPNPVCDGTSRLPECSGCPSGLRVWRGHSPDMNDATWMPRSAHLRTPLDLDSEAGGIRCVRDG